MTILVEIENDGVMPWENTGAYTAILVKLLYPGSRVSDIQIGEHVVQVNNSDLYAAHKHHEDICDTEGG